jgi:hypothetical protein
MESIKIWVQKVILPFGCHIYMQNHFVDNYLF